MAVKEKLLGVDIGASGGDLTARVYGYIENEIVVITRVKLTVPKKRKQNA